MFVSEAYLSNLSLDEDQMSHDLQKTGKRHNLRDCLQPGWEDSFLSGETTLHQDEKMMTSEVDSFPKMLDLIGMIIYVFLTS